MGQKIHALLHVSFPSYLHHTSGDKHLTNFGSFGPFPRTEGQSFDDVHFLKRKEDTDTRKISLDHMGHKKGHTLPIY